MRRVLVLLAAVTAIAACGPTPPDYKALAKVTVDLSQLCGKVTLTGDQIVHAAYDQKGIGTLPDPQSIPSGTLLAATQSNPSAAAITRTLPCADDATTAIANLKKAGYTKIEAAGGGTYLQFFKATDPYGIDGTYGIFKCGFVGDLSQNLTGSFTDQGLHGTFGSDVGPIVDAQSARTFAALTFRTQATQVAAVTTLPALVDKRIIFLGLDTALVPRVFTQGGPSLESLGLCATWVVPDFYGGCDSVAVGTSFTILTDDQGDFQQSPLSPSPVYIFQGYCGRTH